MEYTTIRKYDIRVENEHFRDSREESETLTKRIETLVQNMAKRGWPCKLYRKSDRYSSCLYGVIHEKMKKSQYWLNIGEINENQIKIIGEHPEIHEFLSKYDIRQTKDISSRKRERLYHKNGI